jgi:hypothetical protein
MRKAQDDAVARTAAENVVRDLTHYVNEPVGDLGKDIVGAFKAVEFETISKKVGDEEIPLRRLVITGPWEVDPNGVASK